LGITAVGFLGALALGSPWALRGAWMAGGDGDGRNERTRRQCGLVVAVTGIMLLLLGVFRYGPWVASGFQASGVTLSAARSGPAWAAVVPLGIAFYTLQMIGYVVDVYRGRGQAVLDPIELACATWMFPKLVAGPLVHVGELAQQARDPRPTAEKFTRGAAMLSLGLAKKVLLANPCGRVADTCFDTASITAGDAWYGALAFAFQIYFDFSGYCDMALGLGLMLGFELPRTYDDPYRADAPGAFWRRWHITLAQWWRDYVYIPLGGSRGSDGRVLGNLLLVMLLGGMWYGVGLHYLVWGGLHGLILVGARAIQQEGFDFHLPRVVRVAGTFLLVLLLWVLFRADDLPSALRYYEAMLGTFQDTQGAAVLPTLLYKPYYLAAMAGAPVVIWLCPQTWDYTRRLTPAKLAGALVLLGLALTVMMLAEPRPFLFWIF